MEQIVKSREDDLADEFLSALHHLPNVEVGTLEKTTPFADKGYDIAVDAMIEGKPVKLYVQVKNSIFPRDVRTAFWNLKSHSQRIDPSSRSNQVIPVIAASTISDGAKHLLQTERIGYFEQGGNLFLPGGGLYILIDKPVRKAARKTERAIFSGDRSKVIHALLIHPQEWFTTHQLAIFASVAPSTASVVLAELEKRELLIVRGKGPNKTRKLSHPGTLLDAWAKQVSLLPKPEIRRFYVPMLKPEQLLKKIDEVCVANRTAYVITHEWAAQLYSPFLSAISQVKCRIFPNGPISLILEALKAREVEEGSNLGVIESRSIRDMLFEQKIHGVRVESPILAYLDLIEGEGRSKEMAEHLRRERIGF